MSDDVVFIVGFELGVVHGFDNVRSAHLQLPYRLIQELQDQQYDVRLVTNRLSKQTYFPPEINRIEKITISDPRRRNSTSVMYSGHSKRISLVRTIRAVAELQYHIRQEKPSVVHFTHGAKGVGIFAAIKKMLCPSTRIVWTLTDRFEIKNKVLLLLLKKIDVIIASTDYLTEYFSKQRLAITTIKHGVSRRFSLVKSEKFRVTFWRDPSYSNGADIAFGVFSMLAKTFPNITFTMMVRPHWQSVMPETSELHNLEIHSYPYADGITLEQVLSETILCYFPFRKLSTNPQLCILETLDASIPCVASDIESVGEYLCDSDFLIKQNTVDEGVRTLTKTLTVVDNKYRARPPKSNGFTWDQFTAQHLKVYNLYEGKQQNEI